MVELRAKLSGSQSHVATPNSPYSARLATGATAFMFEHPTHVCVRRHGARDGPIRRRCGNGPNAVALLALTVSLVFATLDASAQPLTLSDALRFARVHNASLPLATYDAVIAQHRVGEARGRFGPAVWIGADLRYAPPFATYGTDVNEERLQVFIAQPIYEGGALRAGLDRADAELRAARAGYRIAERELEYQVRAAFSQAIALQGEIALRREGIERLDDYLSLLRDRQISGQGVAADVARTYVRRLSEQSDLVDVARRLQQANLALNDLMGRDPVAILVLAPLPPPTPAPRTIGSPWSGAPEIARASALLHAAHAAIDVTRAERLPHVALTADTGLLGVGLSPSANEPNALARMRADLGASIGIAFTWAVWDAGVYRERLAAALAVNARAAQAVEVARRSARLAWDQAQVDTGGLADQLGVLRQLAPVARNAFLLSEAQYRGGAATTLEVLDAFTSWIVASESEVSVVLALRLAEAQRIRWGAP